MSSTDMPAGSSLRSDPDISWKKLASRVGPLVPSTGVLIVALVAVALALRLWELGERPFHHDESLDAWWSWLFRNGRYESYDPVYHGPLRFYITAGFYTIFGESEAVARLFSALAGTAAVGLPWFLRRELGRVGAVTAAIGLTISPTMLYYSRFGREDAQMVFLALLAFVLGISYLRRPRVATAVALAFTFSCSFAIKESTYMFGLLLAVYMLVVVAAQFDAQARGETPDEDGELELNRPFFGAALLAASVGLVLAVVVGSAADKLFPMLGLYMAGLAALTTATALPRLRAAAITWSAPRAGVVGACLVALALTVRAYRSEAGLSWGVSPTALALSLGLAALAIALVGLAGAGRISGALNWALAAAMVAIGLAGHEWIERTASLRSQPQTWTLSIPALAIGLAIAAMGAAIYLDRAKSWLPDLPDALPAQPLGAIATLCGLGLVTNEYTESESNRLLAAFVVALVATAITLAVAYLPTTNSPNFTWPPLLRSLGAIGWSGWLIALAVFAATWFQFFTIWGSVKQDWASGFTRAIDYWDSQQEVNRGGQPWFYYLYALPAYEWLFVGLAGLGTWRILRRPTFGSGLFVWFAVGSLILYSYAGERMPWLIAHPLLPVLILAGFGTQQLWANRSHRAIPALGLICVLGLGATTITSLRSSFPNGADSREILSQAGQATPHLTAALDRVDNIDQLVRRTNGETANLAISSANAWPYSWYLRDRPNTTWFTNCGADTDPETCGPPTDPLPDIIIADYYQVNLADYPDYSPTLFAMRSWWVVSYEQGGVGGWLSWARDRSVWEQAPDPDFVPVGEVDSELTELGIFDTIDALRDGANKSSRSFLGYSASDSKRIETDPDKAPVLETGCGSVDQWLLVRNDWAGLESQVYPDSADSMAPLDCLSRLWSTS